MHINIHDICLILMMSMGCACGHVTYLNFESDNISQQCKIVTMKI